MTLSATFATSQISGDLGGDQHEISGWSLNPRSRRCPPHMHHRTMKIYRRELSPSPLFAVSFMPRPPLLAASARADLAAKVSPDGDVFPLMAEEVTDPHKAPSRQEWEIGPGPSAQTLDALHFTHAGGHVGNTWPPVERERDCRISSGTFERSQSLLIIRSLHFIQRVSSQTYDRWPIESKTHPAKSSPRHWLISSQQSDRRCRVSTQYSLRKMEICEGKIVGIPRRKAFS